MLMHFTGTEAGCVLIFQLTQEDDNDDVLVDKSPSGVVGNF